MINTFSFSVYFSLFLSQMFDLQETHLLIEKYRLNALYAALDKASGKYINANVRCFETKHLLNEQM